MRAALAAEPECSTGTIQLGRARAGKLAMLCLVTLLAACAPSDREVDDVREATFRDLFGTWRSALGPAVYCLTIEGHDPADDFMRRFGGNTSPVTKGSRCSFPKSESGPIETETRRHAILFHIGHVTLKWGGRAEVEGGYSEHWLNAGSNNYFLEKKEGVWKVVKKVQLGPSV